jgi:hypothetical protein
MTAISTQSTKSLPNSLALIGVTGSACLKPAFWRTGTVDAGCQTRDVPLPSGKVITSSTALRPGQTFSPRLVKQTAI